MIHVQELSYSYGSHQVLDGLTFTIQEGHLVSILGPNGAGKSTLFKCLLGLIKGYKGSIHVDGHDIATLKPTEMARRMAFIPQVHDRIGGYRVLDMVVMGTTHRLPLYASPGKKEYARAEEALEMLGINELKNRTFMKLSGGEQQLTLIARAITQDAQILIMDEPTSNLDFGNQQKVLTTIQSLCDRGYTIMMSNHNPQQVMAYSDQIMALHQGKVIACGQPKEVMDGSLIERMFQTKVKLLDVDGERLILPILGAV